MSNRYAPSDNAEREILRSRAIVLLGRFDMAAKLSLIDPGPSAKLVGKRLLRGLRPVLTAHVSVIAIAIFGRASDARAQTNSTGTRVRITVSTVTVRELASMLAASDVTNAQVRDRTITLRSPDGRELVVPAPGTTATGVLQAVHDRVVLLQSDREGGRRLLTVPRAAIAKFERMAGRRSRARYAGFGALFGLGAGSLAGLATISCEQNEGFCGLERLKVPIGAVVGAAAGAVAGAIIPPAPRWIPMDQASLSNPSFGERHDQIAPRSLPFVPPSGVKGDAGEERRLLHVTIELCSGTTEAGSDRSRQVATSNTMSQFIRPR
jgi:hypothetical protein